MAPSYGPLKVKNFSSLKWSLLFSLSLFSPRQKPMAKRKIKDFNLGFLLGSISITFLFLYFFMTTFFNCLNNHLYAPSWLTFCCFCFLHKLLEKPVDANYWLFASLLPSKGQISFCAKSKNFERFKTSFEYVNLIVLFPKLR